MCKEKKIIIHMDDIGMNYACNEAAKDLFKKWIVTSASLMVPCAWSYDFVQWCKEYPQYDVGIHVTLTCEWEACRWRPLTGSCDTPGLRDSEGFMHKGNEGFLAKAKPLEIEKEVRMQIEQALAWGLKPSHLDRHMYTICMNPQYFEKYITLAQEYNIPYQMNKKEYEAIDIMSEQVPVKKFDGGISSGEGKDYKTKKSSLIKALEDIKPGFYQLTIHPVKDTPEIREIIPGWWDRYLEYQLFMDDEIIKCMEELKIKRVSWKDIINMEERR